MKRKLFLLLTIILLSSVNVFAQKRIGQGVFMNGNLTDELQKKTLVIFLNADLKLSHHLIKRLKKSRIDAVSYTDFVIPGTQLSDEESAKILTDNEIEVIMYISNESVTRDSGYSMMKYNPTLGGVTNFSLGVPIGKASLNITYFNIKDNFAKPKAVIYTEMDGTFQATWAKSGDGLTKAALKRLLSALERYAKKNS